MVGSRVPISVICRLRHYQMKIILLGRWPRVNESPIQEQLLVPSNFYSRVGPHLIKTSSRPRHNIRLWPTKIEVDHRPSAVTQLPLRRLSKGSLENGRTRTISSPILTIPTRALVSSLIGYLVPGHTLQNHRALLTAGFDREDVHLVTITLHRPHLGGIRVIGIILEPDFQSCEGLAVDRIGQASIVGGPRVPRLDAHV